MRNKLYILRTTFSWDAPLHLFVCVYINMCVYIYVQFVSLGPSLLLPSCKCKFSVVLFPILILRLFLFDNRRLHREIASDSVQIKYLSLCQTGLQPHKITQKEWKQLHKCRADINLVSIKLKSINWLLQYGGRGRTQGFVVSCVGAGNTSLTFNFQWSDTVMGKHLAFASFPVLNRHWRWHPGGSQLGFWVSNTYTGTEQDVYIFKL